ncbi:anti-sigma factor [Mucilaginibacter sp. McL0603]|uniref:anti-sigma factor n=1 Tax=Mucilaginibacter sp. McL0603 TaxID=3415670 RepID=UPI003CF7A8AB
MRRREKIAVEALYDMYSSSLYDVIVRIVIDTTMKEMKSIASVDAFAVTLEPRGGSLGPTIDQMVVIGKF